jgi:hypothetical protein
VAETCAGKSSQVIGFDFSRNVPRHSLPGIPRALDDLDLSSGHCSLPPRA